MTRTNTTFRLRTLTHAVSVASLAIALGMQSSFALEALNADELASVNGQDGITLDINIQDQRRNDGTPPPNFGATEVQAVTIDNVTYTGDGQTAHLSDIKMGGTNQWGATGVNNRLLGKVELDVGSGTYNGEEKAVAHLNATWGNPGDVTNPNRVRIVGDAQIGQQNPENTVARVIYEGSGEVEFDTSSFNYSDTQYSAGFVKLEDNNVYILNPTAVNGTHSGIGLRDLDASVEYRTGIHDTTAKNGSTQSFDYQSNFAVGSQLSADGQQGIFLSSNRLPTDVNFVLTHISNLTPQQYELYRGRGIRRVQDDFIGFKISGELPNAIAKIGTNASAAGEDIFVLLQTTFDAGQANLALPNIAIYQPDNIASDASNYFTTGENDEAAIRLDGVRQFHTQDQFVDPNGITKLKPGTYLPVTIDTAQQTVDGETRDIVRLTLSDPGSNGVLDDNIGLEGGIIDLYIEDLNIGSINTAGNSMGGAVVSLNKINGTIDIAPAQTVADYNGTNGPQEGAMLAVVADVSIADSGLGIINESSASQARIFAGVRDLDLNIKTDGAIGINNEGLHVDSTVRATTNDFQIGIAKAYDSPDQVDLNADFGNLGDPFSEEDVMFSSRVYLNTDVDATIKPTDDGLARVDATVSFIGESDKFDVTKAQNDAEYDAIANQNLIYLVDSGDPAAADPTQTGFAFGLSNIQGGIRTAHTNGQQVLQEDALIQLKNDSVNIKADGTTETVDSLGINLPFEIVESSAGINNLQGDFDVQFHGADQKSTMFNYYVPQGFQGRVNVEVWGQN